MFYQQHDHEIFYGTINTANYRDTPLLAVYKGKWAVLSHWMSVFCFFFRPNANNHFFRVSSACFETAKNITNGDRITTQTSAMKTDPLVTRSRQTWPFPLRIPSGSGCHGLLWEGKHPPIEFIQGPVPIPQGYMDFGLIQAGLYKSTNVGIFKTPKSQMKLSWNIDGQSTKQTSMNRGRS